MAGKIEIPETLKHDLPHTKWGKTLGATPIVMTVIATMLAGLASSEMTKAQYDRAFAAQLQSKAGDQWSYYQAKKLRSAFAHNSFDLLAATADLQPLRPEVLATTNAATIAAFTKNELPAAPPPQFSDALQATLTAVEHSRSESELATALTQVKPAALTEALNAAKDAARAFDEATLGINQDSDRLNDQLRTGNQAVFRSFCAARLNYNAARYDTEARLNQVIANLYELQVRQNNRTAEQHHRRSGKFFFGMLAAQMGVIISTFAIAARQRSLLWAVAAAAGLIAVAFSLYVYLFI